jgi:hypothetical protein
VLCVLVFAALVLPSLACERPDSRPFARLPSLYQAAVRSAAVHGDIRPCAGPFCPLKKVIDRRHPNPGKDSPAPSAANKADPPASESFESFAGDRPYWLLVIGSAILAAICAMAIKWGQYSRESEG